MVICNLARADVNIGSMSPCTAHAAVMGKCPPVALHINAYLGVEGPENSYTVAVGLTPCRDTHG